MSIHTNYLYKLLVTQAPWVQVDASSGKIQIDSASVINASAQAPVDIEQSGVDTSVGGEKSLVLTYLVG